MTLQYFEYEHLPEGPLRSTSRRIHGLAHFLAGDLPDGPEKSAGLRKLLEAKDCFVRAAMSMPPASPVDVAAARHCHCGAVALPDGHAVLSIGSDHHGLNDCDLAPAGVGG